MSFNETLLVEELLAAIEQNRAEQQSTQDELFVIVSAIGILGLQGGFAMLETGVARAKNTKAILMKNLCDFTFGLWAWFIVGYGLYEGRDPYFAGDETAFVTSAPVHFASFVQSFGFAVTGTTIMSGAVLSRMKFEWYILISQIFIAFIYPISAHWAWNGFLEERGFQDFAGSGVVHMIGGIYGIIGAKVCGPRTGRFVYNGFGTGEVSIRSLPGHSSTLQVLGVFMLTMAWLFFNAGSTSGTDRAGIEEASRALINSVLALSTSCTTVVLLMWLRDRTHHLAEAGNGVLAGLVSITGPCGYVDPWAACLIGVAGGCTYLFTSHVVLHRLRIDDPLDAFAVHGACGALGVIMVGVFSLDGGIFYAGNLDLMFEQLIGLGVLVGWATVTACLLFYGLNKAIGISLDEDDQLLGLDVKYHEGYAYPEFSAQDVMEYNRTRDAAVRKMGPRNYRDSESFDNSESSLHSLNDMMSFRANGSTSSVTKGGTTLPEKKKKQSPWRKSWNQTAADDGSEGEDDIENPVMKSVDDDDNEAYV